MPPQNSLIGKKVLVIQFKDPQMIGKVIEENEREILIMSVAYGRQKIERKDIRRIEEIEK